MSSIIRVDTLQKPDGSTPTAADLGIDVAGTVIQQLHFRPPSNINLTAVDTWVDWYSQSFTPKKVGSKVIVTTINLVYGGGSSSQMTSHLIKKTVNSVSTDLTPTDSTYAFYRESSGQFKGAAPVLVAEDVVTSLDPITYTLAFRNTSWSTSDFYADKDTASMIITEIAQ